MAQSWHELRSRGFWAVALGFFLGLELLLRIKLGAVYVMAAAWVLAHQWLAEKLGAGGVKLDGGQKLLFALYCSLVVCVWIFLVFGVLNAAFRTIDNSFTWFQLP